MVALGDSTVFFRLWAPLSRHLVRLSVGLGESLNTPDQAGVSTGNTASENPLAGLYHGRIHGKSGVRTPGFVWHRNGPCV